MKREDKPKPSPDIVTSAEARANYEIELEAWAERRDRALGRVCRWALDLGAPYPKDWCRPPDPG